MGGTAEAGSSLAAGQGTHEGRLTELISNPAFPALLTLGVLALMFVVFALEIYPPEVTAMAGAGVLVAAGVVGGSDMMNAFANPAPWTIAAMFVVSGGLVRTGLVGDLAPLARPMLALKRRMSALGSDTGGMFVRVAGRDAQGAPRAATWTLIARSGDGPYVPALASVILAKRLVAGEGPAPGATACFGLFPLADFEAEVADLDITCTLDRGAAG